MRSCGDVHDELTARGVPHEIVRLRSSSRTAQLAADALGVAVGHVVKTLLFMLDDQRPVLALVSGGSSVNVQALARALGAEDVRLASGREVLDLTGYRPGAVSPCALATAIPVIADPDVFAPEVVYCGAGTTTTMLKILSEDLDELVRPRKLPIAARP